MNLKTCKFCKAVFNAVAQYRELCPLCVLKEQEDYDKVKNYLVDHQGATVTQIMEHVDVRRESVDYFISSGKLASYRPQYVGECRYCQKMVYEPGACADCRHSLLEAIASTSRSVRKGQVVPDRAPDIGGDFKIK